MVITRKEQDSMKKIALILAVLMVFSICFTGCKKETVKTANGTYMDAISLLAETYNGNQDALAKIAPQDAFVYLKRLDFDYNEFLSSAKQEQADFLKEMKQLYGQQAYITISVTDVNNCDAEALKNIGKGLNKAYGIKPASISDAYTMTRTIKIIGTEEVTYESGKIVAAKIDGIWYPLYDHSDEEDPIFYFPYLSQKEINRYS